MDINSITAAEKLCPGCGTVQPTSLFSSASAHALCMTCANDLRRSMGEALPSGPAEVSRHPSYDDSHNMEFPPAYDGPRRTLAETAQEILARRELGRRRLLPFIHEFRANYHAGWVHKLICKKLEKFLDDVIHKRSPRMMLFMPPRSGKSEIISRSFPAWALGKYPWMEIIGCSYAASLAESFSRKVREIIRDPVYANMFGNTALDKSSQSVQQWLTTEGGGYVAAGVGGSIVGKGAHMLLIDDPVKGREEAKSDLVKETVRDWYTGSAYTRLAPGGGVLIIMQRWTEDDLAGWLEALDAENEDPETKENWEIIRFPAIAEEDEEFRLKGAALHPERYDEKAYARIRRTLGERDWHALYQQNPLPATGDYFKSEMFHEMPRSAYPPREEMRVFACWDLACTEDQKNDQSVGHYFGVHYSGYVYVLHIEATRLDSLKLCEKIFELHARFKPQTTWFEDGQINKSIGPFFNKMMRENGTYIYWETVKTGGWDKSARATSVRALMQQGIVIWPEHDSTYNDGKAEMLKFPNGKHDDHVDSAAYMGIKAEELMPKAKVEPPKRAGWREKFLEHMAGVAAGGGTEGGWMGV